MGVFVESDGKLAMDSWVQRLRRRRCCEEWLRRLVWKHALFLLAVDSILRWVFWAKHMHVLRLVSARSSGFPAIDDSMLRLSIYGRLDEMCWLVSARHSILLVGHSRM